MQLSSSDIHNKEEIWENIEKKKAHNRYICSMFKHATLHWTRCLATIFTFQ